MHQISTPWQMIIIFAIGWACSTITSFLLNYRELRRKNQELMKEFITAASLIRDLRADLNQAKTTRLDGESS